MTHRSAVGKVRDGVAAYGGRSDESIDPEFELEDLGESHVADQWRRIAELVGPTWLVGECDSCGGWFVVRRVTRGARVGLPRKPLRSCRYCAGHVDRPAEIEP